jgi:hypothetical protein
MCNARIQAKIPQLSMVACQTLHVTFENEPPIRVEHECSCHRLKRLDFGALTEEIEPATSGLPDKSLGRPILPFQP